MHTATAVAVFSSGVAGPTTPLIGRERELERVASLLGAGHRVVHITGPAGAGKSRLLEACVQGWPGQAAPRVVDDAERLSEPELRELRRGAVAPILLASRLGVDLPEVPVVRLGPLALQPCADAEPLCPALRLFESRVRSRSTLRAVHDLERVSAICDRLDGLPGGIEHAADQLTTMSLEELELRLQTGGERAIWCDDELPDVLGAADLDDRDRAFLRDCRVFAGDFRLEDAESVVDRSAAFRLRRLVARSLVIPLAPPAPSGGPLFRIPFLTRAGLDAAPRAPVMAAHARHYHREAVRLGVASLQALGSDAPERLLACTEDLRTAARPASPRRSNGDAARIRAAECLSAAAQGVALRGHAARALRLIAEGLGELARTERGGARAERIELRLLLDDVRVRLRLLDYEGAKRQSERAARLAPRADAELACRAGALAALSDLYAGHRERSARQFREVADIARACSASTQGFVLAWQGLTDGADERCANERLAEAVRLLDGSHHRAEVLVARRNQAFLLLRQGRIEPAMLELWGARALAIELRDPILLASVEGYQGIASILSRRAGVAEAVPFLARSTARLAAHGYRGSAGELRVLEGACRLAAGDARGAAEALAVIGADEPGGRVAAEGLRSLIALSAGARVEAMTSWARAREGLERGPSTSGGATALVRGLDALLSGQPVLAALLERPDAAPSDRALALVVQQCLSRFAGPRSPAVLRVGATRFSIDGGLPVDLSRRGSMRRVLRALAERAVASPDELLDVEALFGAGWPGDRASPHSAARRVHTCLWSLRRAGLGALLERDDAGYRLAPSARVLLEE